MKIISIALFVMLITTPAALSCTASDVPDDTCTPGVVASTDEADVCAIVNGESYSKQHRHTSSQLKSKVAREYGRSHCGEIDHRLELSLGGADAEPNLWCQPGPTETEWNFRLKDRLEAYAWRQVCHLHAMSLQDAQTIFLPPNDWRVAYCRYIGGPPCPK